MSVAVEAQIQPGSDHTETQDNLELSVQSEINKMNQSLGTSSGEVEVSPEDRVKKTEELEQVGASFHPSDHSNPFEKAGELLRDDVREVISGKKPPTKTQPGWKALKEQARLLFMRNNKQDDLKEAA